MEIFHVLCCQKKGYTEGNGFSTLYLHLLCLLVCVGRKEIYKGRETEKAIKRLAFSHTVQLTKSVTRLGAAEVPADREASVVSLSLLSH